MQRLLGFKSTQNEVINISVVVKNIYYYYIYTKNQLSCFQDSYIFIFCFPSALTNPQYFVNKLMTQQKCVVVLRKENKFTLLYTFSSSSIYVGS